MEENIIEQNQEESVNQEEAVNQVETVNQEETIKTEPSNDLDKPMVEKKLKGKVRALRNWVIACYYVCCGIFFGVMGYFALSIVLSMFIPESLAMFGGDANKYSLGIAGVLGALYYVFIFGIALLPIAIAFMFRNGKAGYVRVLKGANKENMEIVFARLEYVSMLIYELIFTVLLLFAVVVCFTNNLLVVSILLGVTLIVSIVFNILVIVDLIRNRVAYNRLTDEEREEIKVKIKSFRKVRHKKERKKRAGKLY